MATFKARKQMLKEREQLAEEEDWLPTAEYIGESKLRLKKADDEGGKMRVKRSKMELTLQNQDEHQHAPKTLTVTFFGDEERQAQRPGDKRYVVRYAFDPPDGYKPALLVVEDQRSPDLAYLEKELQRGKAKFNARRRAGKTESDTESEQEEAYNFNINWIAYDEAPYARTVLPGEFKLVVLFDDPRNVKMIEYGGKGGKRKTDSGDGGADDSSSVSYGDDDDDDDDDDDGDGGGGGRGGGKRKPARGGAADADDEATSEDDLAGLQEAVLAKKKNDKSDKGDKSGKKKSKRTAKDARQKPYDDDGGDDDDDGDGD